MRTWMRKTIWVELLSKIDGKYGVRGQGQVEWLWMWYELMRSQSVGGSSRFHHNALHAMARKNIIHDFRVIHVN